jgi:hypothetical protein
MRKIFFLFWFSMSVILCHGVDLECPNQFHIRQDPVSRFFRIHEDGKFLGAIVNSGYGRLDFYDADENKQWANLFDLLYDNTGDCIGSVKVASDAQWVKTSTRIEIFSKDEELLAMVQAEGDGKCFVFRDAETLKILAIALWSWVPIGKNWIPLFDNYVQDWSVIIVDRMRLQEKRISNVFLIWSLLKHSQKHFPSPDDLPFVDRLPSLR